MEITWKIDTSVSESSCILERTHYPELEDIFGRITPINVRRRPLFVRTRSLRSVANFSRGASPSRFIDLPDISMAGPPWSNPCRCER